MAMPTSWLNVWSTKMAPALYWFNYAGLATTDEMDWNEAEAHLIPKSNTKLTAIATMEFDCLDCPDLTQTDTVNWPTIDTEDLSVASIERCWP